MRQLSSLFTPVGYEQCTLWNQDDQAAAFAAFRRCAFQSLEKPYRTGSLGVDFSAFNPAYEAARNAVNLDPSGARSFFENFFIPCFVGSEDETKGFVTGYYEPEVKASISKTDDYVYPLYRRPVDLIDIDDNNRPESLDPYFAFARQIAGADHLDAEIKTYYDRREIDQGALAGRNLEIAYLQNKADAFFIHVQGSARLKFSDGEVKRVSYAAKSGHPFSAIGKILADRGEIPLADVTMQSIRAWLKNNPDRADELLWNNQSYIFFREMAVNNPVDGPIGAAKVPLTEGRSMAVDRLLHTFGTPFYVSSDALTAIDDQPFHRLMIAQDTGSAIIGAARGDLFAGSGDDAGEIAGIIKHAADFYALIPRELIEARS